jgi:pilus assembly protein CpaC
MTGTPSHLKLLVAALAIAGSIAWAQTEAEDLRLTVGKSIVIDYPADIRQISTSNPEIADASPVTTREILVHGKGLGAATMIVWSKTGGRTFYTISVDANLEPLRRLLKQTFPTEDINVQSSRDSLALTGHVSSVQVGERATALATPFGRSVVNNLQIGSGPVVEKQILLKVKFAELDRIKSAQYGVNILSLGAANTPGSISTGQFSPPRPSDLSGTIGGHTAGTTTNFSVSDALNIFAFRPDLNLAAFVKALQNEAILQILAEPNLVTTNGKEASFLVGGEFPVPILQGGSNSGSVTVQFREFGIRLLFTPVLTESQTIKLHLRQEVSTIDLGNAVTLNGFTIPALSTRRAETDIELGQGQSFVVAGLIDNRETENISKIPGLSSLPIFGALFKSKDIRKNRTELVMIVTPEITKPLNPSDKQPVPYFPKDFLVPLAPPDKTAAAVAPEEKTAGNHHWYSIRKQSN